MALPEPQLPTPVFIEADRLLGRDENVMEAIGHARLRKHGKAVQADRMLLQQDTQDLEAEGHVEAELDGNTLSGTRLRLNLDTGMGLMEQPEFGFAGTRARAAASVLEMADSQHFQMDDARYTSCAAGSEDWFLRMQTLELDRARQVGVSHHAWIEFKGVPILYTPWMDFPLDESRKSGFLAPVFSSTSQGGSELTVPYYWNIAPNLDATFAPRMMTKRGVLFNNEFRYLQPDFGGTAQADFMLQDRLTDGARSHVSLQHQQYLGGNFNAFLDLNRVSDDAYYRDLADSLAVSSRVNLLNEGRVQYSGGWWESTLRMQRYQTLQDPAAPIASPYARLPQWTLDARHDAGPLHASFSGEYVDFAHPSAVNAQRMVMIPSLSYQLFDAPGYFLTPRASLHVTRYLMGRNNAAGLADANRALPIFSVDSGMALERETELGDGDYVQTLEPRAYFVYVPYRDQSALPNFDSAQATFSFGQLFTENRFFGNDRIGDANQLTLAVTSRLLDRENGVERLKMTLGERFSFSAPLVNLVEPARSASRSDILLGLSGELTPHWSMDGEFQYDPNLSHTQRYNASVRYRPEPGKALNFGYRFLRDTLRQVDVSAQWPLSGYWHGVGRWNYSLQENRVLEAIAGLEYNRDCWTLRLVGQRYTVGTQQANTGFFLQLELNDLVKVGSDPLGVLRNSILGYTKMNDQPAEPATRVLR